MKLSNIIDRLGYIHGLSIALSHEAWNIEAVAPPYKKEFSAVLSLVEVVENSIENLYSDLKSEV